jgi:hypothetical protein
VAAVQLGRRIRASVSRFDESTREETSVNAKPNDPLRTFHEAVLNYGVDITKTDPAGRGGYCGKQAESLARRQGLREVPDSNSMHPASDCGATDFPDFGGAGHRGGATKEFLFLLKL